MKKLSTIFQQKKIYLLLTLCVVGISVYYFVALNREKAFKRSQFLMNTLVDITVIADHEKKADRAMQAAFREIKRIENLMSVHLQNSNIYQINKEAGQHPIKMKPEVLEIISQAIKYGELSKGAFDLTIGIVKEIWDFEREGHIPSALKLAEILPLVDYRQIEINSKNSTIRFKKSGMKIDLGGIAKGYAVDRAIEILKDEGITNAIVNAGGDLRLMGKKQGGELWSIGIQHPRKNSGVIAKLKVTDKSMVTSGDYERFFEVNGIRYHHILDPKTGFPAQDCQSVTIFAQKTIEADALATAVFVLGVQEGLKVIEKLPEVEGMIVSSDGSVILSSGLKNVLTLEE